MPGEIQRRDDEGQPQEGATIPPAAEVGPIAGAEAEKPFNYGAEFAPILARQLERESGLDDFIEKFEATGALDAPEVKAIKAVSEISSTKGKIEWLARSKAQKERVIKQYPEKATEPMWQIISAERQAAAIEDQRIAILAERNAAEKLLKEKMEKIAMQAEIAAEIKKQTEIAAKERAGGGAVLENKPPVKVDNKKVEDLMAGLDKI